MTKKGDYNGHLLIILQIFNEKSETRDAELAVLESKMNNDVIVLAHTRNKVEQLAAANADLERRVAADASELDTLKKKESRLKGQLVSLTRVSRNIKFVLQTKNPTIFNMFIEMMITDKHSIFLFR